MKCEICDKAEAVWISELLNGEGYASTCEKCSELYAETSDLTITVTNEQLLSFAKDFYELGVKHTLDAKRKHGKEYTDAELIRFAQEMLGKIK